MSAARAIIVKKFGDLSNTVVESYELPPLDGRIEVEVQYCGVNFSDIYSRLGFLHRNLPFVLGSECTGVIKDVGLDSKEFKVGQRVVCYNYKGGMYSCTVRVDPENVFHLPNDVPFDVGAALFVNYLTAYFAVYELGNFKPNETILINSCAGGVGWAATQLARTVERTKIYGTASKSKKSLVEENGVDVLLPYYSVVEDLKGYEPDGIDVIIENQTERTFHDSLTTLAPMGRMVLTGINCAIKENYVSYYTMLKMWWKSWWFSLTDLVVNNRCIAGLHLGTLLEKDRNKVENALNDIFDLYREGRVKPKIDSIWPFEDYQYAIKVLTQRQNVGKVLLKVK